MKTLLKSLLIASLGCCSAQVLAMKQSRQLLPIEATEDDMHDIYLADGKSMLDEKLYTQLLSLIKPSVKDALERESRKELREISKLGLEGILSNLETILKKDTQALRAIYLQYMADKKHEEFCELVSAAQNLGIEAVVSTAQEFFAHDYKILIDQEDSTFFIKLLIFQRNRFSGLGTLGHQEDGSTLMGYAASQGKGDIVATLLASKEDGNCVDDEGFTPLMHAAQKGHSKVVALLVRSNVSFDYQNKDGRSALMEASIVGNSESVRMLLSARASTELADTKGMTALHHAVMQSHDDCILLLGGKDALDNKRKMRSELMMHLRNQASAVQPIQPSSAIQPVQPSVVQIVQSTVDQAVQPPSAPQALAEDDVEAAAKKLSLLPYELVVQEAQSNLANDDAEFASPLQKNWELEQEAEAVARRFQEQEQAEFALVLQSDADAAYASQVQEEIENLEQAFVLDSEFAWALYEEELLNEVPVEQGNSDEKYAQRLQVEFQEQLEREQHESQVLQDEELARQLGEPNGFGQSYANYY